MSKHKCGACGKDPAAGYAKIGATRYCHGDYDACPTCYERSQRDYLPGGIKIMPDDPSPDTSTPVGVPGKDITPTLMALMDSIPEKPL